MIRASVSLGTTFLGMPMPVPVMMDFIGSDRIQLRVRRGVQRAQIVRVEAVLPPAELAGHFRPALPDHLLQLLGAEESQRREGALAAARAGVAERHVEA